MAAAFSGANPDDAGCNRCLELQAMLKRLRAKSGSCRRLQEHVSPI
jgi:hypothetical protein